MSQAKSADDGDDHRNRGRATGLELGGEIILSESTAYEITHTNYEDGLQILEITMEGAETLEIELALDLDEAEEFVTRVRDEIVRAKRDQLEWQTNTDPETGINENDA